MTKRTSLAKGILALLIILLASCGSSPEKVTYPRYFCAPTFAVPTGTTATSELMHVPEAGNSVRIANAGEPALRFGAYTRITTATVNAETDLAFLFPSSLGYQQDRSRTTLPSWVREVMPPSQLEHLITENPCEAAMISADRGTLSAIDSNAAIIRAAENTPGDKPAVLSTRPVSWARGNLIPTVNGTLVSGLEGKFTPMTRAGEQPPWGVLAKTGVTAEGLFLPRDPALPNLILIKQGEDSLLYPALGAVDLKDRVSKFVRRQIGPATRERVLRFSGGRGGKIRFVYQELASDSPSPTFTQQIDWAPGESRVVHIKGAQLEILEATPTQLRYRILKGFDT